MLNYYETVKKYYDKGYYSKLDVAVFVKAEKITREEFKEITGEEYVEVLKQAVKDGAITKEKYYELTGEEYVEVEE